MHQFTQDKAGINSRIISTGDTSGTEDIFQDYKRFVHFQREHFSSSAADLPNVVNQKIPEGFTGSFAAYGIDFFDIESGTVLIEAFKKQSSIKRLPCRISVLTEDKQYLAEETISSVGIGTSTSSAGRFIFYRNVEPYTQLGTCTVPDVPSVDIKNATYELIRILKFLPVEVDLTEQENKFNEDITLWAVKYNHTALSIIDEYFKTKVINIEQMSSILTVLGNIRDLSTYYQRLFLLRGYLLSEFEEIRYGAIAGLSGMNARESLANLKEILKVEEDYPLIGLLKTTISKFEQFKHS